MEKPERNEVRAVMAARGWGEPPHLPRQRDPATPLVSPMGPHGGTGQSRGSSLGCPWTPDESLMQTPVPGSSGGTQRVDFARLRCCHSPVAPAEQEGCAKPVQGYTGHQTAPAKGEQSPPCRYPQLWALTAALHPRGSPAAQPGCVGAAPKTRASARVRVPVGSRLHFMHF